MLVIYWAGLLPFFFKIDDNRKKIDRELFLGLVAIECSSSGRLSLAYGSYDGEMEAGLDSMWPRIGWFMYEK